MQALNESRKHFYELTQLKSSRAPQRHEVLRSTSLNPTLMLLQGPFLISSTLRTHTHLSSIHTRARARKIYSKRVEAKRVKETRLYRGLYGAQPEKLEFSKYDECAQAYVDVHHVS